MIKSKELDVVNDLDAVASECAFKNPRLCFPSNAKSSISEVDFVLVDIFVLVVIVVVVDVDVVVVVVIVVVNIDDSVDDDVDEDSDPPLPRIEASS